MVTTEQETLSIGPYLAVLRDKAGFTQAEVAKKMTVSPAQVSRIEGGDRGISREELKGFLAAIGTKEAKEFKVFLEQDWKELGRPLFDHPNRNELWASELMLQEISAFYKDPNLKHVFRRQIETYEKEIRRYAVYLESRDHLLAMIGAIGVGKTTGICSLVDLEVERKDSPVKEPALEVGGGGVTICEVHVKQGPQYGILVTPRTDEQIRADVSDFCEYMLGISKGTLKVGDDEQEGQENSLGISKEIVRAIRNMARLTVRKKKKADGKILREDPARELASKVTDVRELIVKVLERMNLPRRDRRDIWYPASSGKSPMIWLQEVYATINNCRHPDFSLPARIEVVIPKPVLGITDFNIRIVDTKGIDQTAGRPDLEPHFDDPQTIVILCSKFNDAPDNYTQQLLRRAKEVGVSDISLKTAIVVLPRPDEARAMKEDDGTKVENDEEGYDLKREQVEMRLHTLVADDVKIEFFNVRKDGPKRLRSFLIERIEGLRSRYKERLSELAHATRNLIANHENEQAQAAIREAAKRLTTWLNNNKAIDPLAAEVEESLLGTMEIAHASTIRASVRRYGDWPNLDYPHHLGFGARSIAARLISAKVDGFKAIAENILQDQELIDAHEFVQQAVRLLESTTDEFLKRTQITGQSAFSEDLENDQDFWMDCMGQWGMGPGYRDRVTSRNRDWFSAATHQGPRDFIRNMIVAGWNQIMDDLHRLLQVDSGVSKAAN